MEVTGKLHAKFDTQDVSASFKKRDFVLMISENPQYPQYVSFQLTQEKCALVDVYESGADVTVHFNLRGRAWTSPQGETKYFNTLEAWSMRPAMAQSGQTHTQNPIVQNAPQAPPVEASNPVDNAKMNDSDDLPF